MTVTLQFRDEKALSWETGMHSFSWTREADGSHVRTAIAGESIVAWAFTGGHQRDAPHIDDYPQVYTTICGVRLSTARSFGLDAWQRAWRNVRYDFPAVGMLVHVNAPVTYGFSYAVPSDGAVDWSQKTVHLVEPFKTSEALFNWLSSEQRLSHGFVELFLSRDEATGEYALALKGCHSIADGHGGFMLLDALLRHLVDDTGEPEEWGSEVSRLPLQMSSYLGRKDGSPLTEEQQQHLQASLAMMQPPSNSFLLKTRSNVLDLDDDVYVREVLSPEESKRFLATCKAAHATFGETTLALYPIAMYRAARGSIEPDSLHQMIVPMCTRKWTPDLKRTEGLFSLWYNAPMGSAPELSSLIDAGKPLPRDSLRPSKDLLAQGRKAQGLASTAPEVSTTVIPIMEENRGKTAHRGMTALSMLLPIDQFTRPHYGPIEVHDPRCTATTDRTSVATMHIITFKNQIAVSFTASLATFEESTVRTFVKEMCHVMRTVRFET